MALWPWQANTVLHSHVYTHTHAHTFTHQVTMLLCIVELCPSGKWVAMVTCTANHITHLLCFFHHQRLHELTVLVSELEPQIPYLRCTNCPDTDQRNSCFDQTAHRIGRLSFSIIVWARHAHPTLSASIVTRDNLSQLAERN